MVDLLIASLDFIGFLGFTVAFVYSIRNFYNTRHISLTWLLLVVAMSFLMLFSFLNVLEWVDFYPSTMDEIQNSALVAAIVSIFTSVLITREEFFKPVSR